jgi:3-hydroxybutyryl-CoA dehydrogenase
MSEIKTVGVIGAGQMGTGIAHVCALSGYSVILHDLSEDRAAAGIAGIERNLNRQAARGMITMDQVKTALSNITPCSIIAQTAKSDLVIEAATEDEAIKKTIFRSLTEHLGPDTLLASNTSSIPIMKLATVTSRPEQVVGLHFFNPVPVLPLVELVASLMTSQATSDTVSGFASDVLGKNVIRSQDRAGFVVNALLIPYLLSAIRMLESGFATAADIDAGMVHGCAHPMGPLALADLIGLDTTMAVAESMYTEFKEPLYAPPPLLSRMCEAGLLGRKTGRGFHNYQK